MGLFQINKNASKHKMGNDSFNYRIYTKIGTIKNLIDVFQYGQKFPTKWFVGNFIQPTYKIGMCYLNM
jgi:hypothetical protein